MSETRDVDNTLYRQCNEGCDAARKCWRSSVVECGVLCVQENVTLGTGIVGT
jgi:hypothetical protein